MESKMTGFIVGGLAIALALGMRDAAIPEGHIEVSTPAESAVVHVPAQQTANVEAKISRNSFDTLHAQEPTAR
jgi:hypothetical protein